MFPVPVDEQGLCTERLAPEPAAAVYVTPSHQFPLGGILSASRRVRLLEFARRGGLYIVEDDYDSEFRYTGEPVAPLAAMDGERVIYVGTFSKVLFPALRIGYAVLPKALQSRWKYLRTHTDVQNPPYEQLALALYMKERKLDRHIRKMRGIYGARRQALLDAVRERMGDAWRAWGDGAGLHVALAFPGKCFDGDFFAHAKRQGVCVAGVGQYSIQKGRHTDKLLLGYGHLAPEEIKQGVQLLADVINEAERP